MKALSRAFGLVHAVRIPPEPLPKGGNVHSKKGLVYERKVAAALTESFSELGPFDLSLNPWFEFNGTFGNAKCVPDLLISMQEGPFKDTVFVIECKLTFVPEAIEKLLGVYCPVVSKAMNLQAFPMVICKNVARNMGDVQVFNRFFDAVSHGMTSASVPVLQWLEFGRIQLAYDADVQSATPLIR